MIVISKVSAFLSKSMNSVHAFIAHSFNDRCPLELLEAFVIHTRLLSMPFLLFSGISPTPSRNNLIVCQGIPNASELSCEIGENGFDVFGKGFIPKPGSNGMDSYVGAVCGESLDKEFGKTSVIRAR